MNKQCHLNAGWVTLLSEVICVFIFTILFCRLVSTRCARLFERLSAAFTSLAEQVDTISIKPISAGQMFVLQIVPEGFKSAACTDSFLRRHTNSDAAEATSKYWFATAGGQATMATD